MSTRFPLQGPKICLARRCTQKTVALLQILAFITKQLMAAAKVTISTSFTPEL